MADTDNNDIANDQNLGQVEPQPEYVQPRPELSDEEIAQHHSAMRELVQNLRNRGDQDVNRVLDNITAHLDALDPQEEAA